jgi:hypothetical protein
MKRREKEWQIEKKNLHCWQSGSSMIISINTAFRVIFFFFFFTIASPIEFSEYEMKIKVLQKDRNQELLC